MADDHPVRRPCTGGPDGEEGGAVLLWPTVTVLGFVALTVLVVALGSSSTARYELERSRARTRREQVAVAGGTGRHRAEDRPGAAAAQPDRSGGAPAAGRPPTREANRVATAHPAGRALRDAASAWWLVDDPGDAAGPQIVDGPFADSLEAGWAALSGGLPDSVRAVHGVRRADGGLVRKQLPQERAWLAQLGTELDRLGEDWDEQASDTDALTTLLVEVTAALVEAGLALHDRAAGGPGGGVCLVPDPAGRGVLVSWRQHDRMSVQQVRGSAVDTAVQRTMTAAVADVLAQMGFQITPFGSTGCHLVTGAQRSALTP